MKIRVALCCSAAFLTAFSAVGDALAYMGRLSPQNFNKMYYLATQGQVGVLRNAVNRGLNIDAMNPNGDTGLCIAIKHRNYVAYNSFRMSGANPRHACTYEIEQEYREFLEESKAVRTDKIVGNEESLYYNEHEKKWWPWIAGGAVLAGAGALAFGGKSSVGENAIPDDATIVPINPGYGLATQIEHVLYSVEAKSMANDKVRFLDNEKASVFLDKISLLPNVLANSNYLLSYVKVTEGGFFDNLRGAELQLSEATMGIAVVGEGSKAINHGNIEIEAANGVVGMAASNGAKIINGYAEENNPAYGNINLTFTGDKDGQTVIGMYGDTSSDVINEGNINGTTYLGTSSSGNGNNKQSTAALDDLWNDIIEDIEDSEEEEEKVLNTKNVGNILGMVLFDLYTGTDYSGNTVTAENYGNIILSAGYGGATDMAVNLVGMGSYIDEAFLNGKNNPAYAENMVLNNYGNINLAYQGSYIPEENVFKLGKGGLVGMRADASTKATNEGNIQINLTSMKQGARDIAGGMLSVHGAELINGSKDHIYTGKAGEEVLGSIRIINEASLPGVPYGMVAAAGEGSQTRIYNWKDPKLYNYGLIDMQASQAYAMASFAAGDIINYGIINLGVENGQSYYKGNYGLYGAGEDKTKEILLANKGTINVYSETSSAIYNAFSGSVKMINDGHIYVSNKATDSTAFAGNFSSVYNNGSILYKVGNSSKLEIPLGSSSELGYNLRAKVLAGVIKSSENSKVTKQLLVNNGDIDLGDVRKSDVDYGGTYGTAAMYVAKQGSAINNGTITLESFNSTVSQFNAGIFLEDSTTAEAYGDNYGNIKVKADNSIGMRNSSVNNASMTNSGNIYVDGAYSYGMAVNEVGANIYNGRNTDSTGSIYVKNYGAVGMYIKEGNAFNYGSIYLQDSFTSAFVLDGKTAVLNDYGNIYHNMGLEDIVYFKLVNSAEMGFDVLGTINGYTLGKAISKGKAYLSSSSTVYVKGENSHLFVAEDEGEVTNYGQVYADEGATAVKVANGGKFVNAFEANIDVIEEKSVGVYAQDDKSSIKIEGGGTITVDAGIGLKASNLATVLNQGNLIVNHGVGMYLTGARSSTVFTSGNNDGFISVTGADSKGVEVASGAKFYNANDITVSCPECSADKYAYGVYSLSTATAINTGDGNISVGSNGIGMYGTGISNSGTISVDSSSAYGIYNTGKSSNIGTINVYSGIGGYAPSGEIKNNATVNVRGGTGLFSEIGGVIDNTGYVYVYSTDKGGIYILGSGSNGGNVYVYGSTGVYVKGGSFSNTGKISGSGTGVRVVDGGSFVNSGTIELTGGTGVYVTNAHASNENKISVSSGSGAEVGNNGRFINSGTITVNDGYGIYVNGKNAYGSNAGAITITNNGYGGYVGEGTFVNTGTITVTKDETHNGYCANVSIGGTCINTADAKKDEEKEKEKSSTSVASNFVHVANGQFVNQGNVDLSGLDIDFNDFVHGENGAFAIADGGTYAAGSLKGNVIVSNDIVTGGFDDVYVNEKSFVGEDKGLTVQSGSYMFDAALVDGADENSLDVEMKRKSFDELIEEEDVAEFLETNYQLAHNEKMYNALKSAENKAEFVATAEVETGQNFYANLPKENMAVLRGLNTQEQNRILEEGLDGVVAGADYYRTGKDATNGLSGYADNVYSPYVGFGKQLDRNWSMGGTLRLAYADADYKEANSQRDNKILLAMLPIMYQNGGFKFLTSPSVGGGYGTYKRHALSGEYEADTLDLYYGMYNHAEYNIDLKIAELVAEAELNLQGSYMSEAKEDDGLNLASNNSVSLEAGVGVKLRKRIQLAKERSLMLAIGTKYYHELLDPYKDLSVGMNGSPVDFSIKGYDEDKNRLRTAAEAIYKDGDFSVAAEIAHNAEKESNVEGGLGVRYNF